MKNETKRIKREVKRLVKEKKYDEIYHEYGPKYFRKYVSKKYKKQDINELRGKGKYLEIYAKYGKLDLESKIRVSSALKNKELPAKNGSIARTWGYIKIWMASLLSIISVGYGATKLKDPMATQLEINSNKKQYEQQIEDYNKKIEEYSKKFDITKQSDLEIIMRCMADLHSTIEGYGTPKLDLVGYRGLDVIDEGGIGVCRNFAPNIADKLNAINPEYNARTITIYDKAENFIGCNIEEARIDENGNKIITKENGKEIYKDDVLIQKSIITDDAIVEYFYDEKGEIIKQVTNTEDEKISISYEEGKKVEQRRKENETVQIVYDENDKIETEMKMINELKDGVYYDKTFIDGKLTYLKEEAEEYYKVTMYNMDGSLSSEIEADSNKEVTKRYSYITGNLYTIAILENGIETTIKYDENGNEISRNTQATDRVNEYIESQAKKQEGKNFESDLYTAIAWEKFVQDYMKDNEIPNHEIVAVDIESDNITLLIDPTMLGLGVYKDGNIVMFNEQNSNEATYTRGDIIKVAEHNGMGQFTQYPIDYIKSFKEPILSIEELEAKYGLDAQNKMLEQIEKQDSERSFKETLKINKNDKTSVSYDFENNIAYIENNKLEDKINTDEDLTK